MNYDFHITLIRLRISRQPGRIHQYAFYII